MSFGFGFGAASSSQSVFGAPGQSSQSLFGAPGQSSQSLFGAPGQSSQSLFGAPGQSSQSLFGAPAQSSQSLFGAAASSQSVFGAPQSTQSVFGAPQSSQSLFGAPQSSQSLFGQPQSAPSMFAPPQSAPSLFTQPQAQQYPQQHAQPQLPRSLTDLVERLNPLHPESQFHAALYNVVSPGDISRYTRPQNFDEKLWNSAVSQNPDPSRMVPVQANNFDDLLTRAEMQSGRLKDHVGVLAKLGKELSAMEEQSCGSMGTKLAAYRRSHRELGRKLLRIAAVVDAAVAREGGMNISQGEMERKRRVDGIAKALAAPAEFKGKLADLVEVTESRVLGGRVGGDVEIRDARAEEMIRELLRDQLRGIGHLGEVCERTERDVGIMMGVLEGR